MIENFKNRKVNFKAGFTPTPFLLLLPGFFARIFATSTLYIKERFLFLLNVLRNKKTTVKMVSGFTLVELLVTMTMFVIITGVVLVNSNQFDNTILLNNFAYDVALTIKQAQTYGVNVKESISGSFDSYYGVYFDTTKNIGSNTNFVFFDYSPLDPLHPDFSAISTVDITQPCSNYNECIQKYTIKKGIVIKSLCAKMSNESNCTNYDKLVVMFKRPSLSAKIYAFNNGDSIVAKDYVNIVLASANGATSSVVVTSPGQIYIKK